MNPVPFRIVFCLGFAALATGCIIIPVDYHPPGVRHNISSKTQARLEPGLTTKSEVFLLLGEPDHALRGLGDKELSAVSAKLRA